MTQNPSPSTHHGTLARVSLLGLPASGGPRLCGHGRTAGSIYLECGLAFAGTPPDTFLCDPPIQLDAEQTGLSAVGHKMIELQGQWCVIDWVGSRHYQTVADFVEEARLMGISRKVARSLDFRALAGRGDLLLYHPRGRLDNPDALAPWLTDFTCPTGRHGAHERCAGHHWSALSANVPGRAARKLVSGSYPVKPPPAAAPAPMHVGAIFMRVPISRLVVVEYHDGSVDRDSLRAARQSGLPVGVVKS